MLNRLVYLGCGLCLAGLVVIADAFGMLEVRLVAVIVVLLGVVVASWWASRRGASVMGQRIVAGVWMKHFAGASLWLALACSCTAREITPPSVAEESPIELHVEGPAPKRGISPNDPALYEVRSGSWCPNGAHWSGLGMDGPRPDGTVEVRLHCPDGSTVVVRIIWDE